MNSLSDNRYGTGRRRWRNPLNIFISRTGRSLCLVDSESWRHRSAFLFIQGVVDDASVVESDLSSLGVDKRHSVLSPVLIHWNFSLAFEGLGIIELVDSVLEVLSGVGTTGFLSSAGRLHGHSSVDHQVLELERFNQVSVPDHSSVVDLHVLHVVVDFLGHLATVLEGLGGSEDGGVVLHDFLHLSSKGSSVDLTVSHSNSVNVSNRFFAISRLDWSEVIARFAFLGDGVSASSAKDDQIEKRVGTESVCAVNRGASSLTSGVEPTDDLVFSFLVHGEDLALPVGWDTSHVVMDSWENWNWLLGDVNAGEDLGGFRNTRKSSVELLNWKMVELEVHVILVETNTSAGSDFHGRSSGDDVSGSKILGGRGVSLHVSLTLGVDEDSTFASATFGDEASSAVDTSWVELDELEIGVVKTGSGDHGHTVSGAGVGGGARLPGTTVTASSENSVLSVESMNRTVFHADSHATDAVALVVHDQISREVLDKVGCVVVKRSSVKSVEKRMTSSVGDAAASMSLATFSVFERLTAKRSLVDLAFWRSRERHTVVLELDDGVGSFSSHVVDGVLVAEPIGALDSVVHVVLPAVFFHVAESGVDSALSGDRVRSSWEELGDASSVEASFREAKGSAETSSTGADDESVEFVIDDFIRVSNLLLANDGGRSSGEMESPSRDFILDHL